MDIEKRLSALGLELPAPPTPEGNYVGSVRVDNLLFVGGNVGRLNAEPLAYTGKVGGDVTLEQAYEMARQGHWGQMAAVRGNRIVSVPLEEAVGELKRLDEEIHRIAEVFFG